MLGAIILRTFGVGNNEDSSACLSCAMLEPFTDQAISDVSVVQLLVLLSLRAQGPKYQHSENSGFCRVFGVWAKYCLLRCLDPLGMYDYNVDCMAT